MKLRLFPALALTLLAGALPAIGQAQTTPNGTQTDQKKLQRAEKAAIAHQHKAAIDARIRAQHEHAVANSQAHAAVVQRNAELQARLKRQHEHGEAIKENSAVQANIRREHANAVAKAKSKPKQ